MQKLSIKKILLSLISAIIFTLPLHATSLEEAYLTLAQHAQTENNNAQTAEYYNKVLQCNEHNQEALLWLGVESYRNNNIEQAINFFKRRINEGPCATSEFYLGVMLSTHGEISKAIEHLQNALDLNPMHEIYHLYLGIALQRQQKLSEALAAFKQAIALNNALPEAHVRAGTIQRQQKQFDDALTSIEQALLLNPNDKRIRLELAHTLTMMGKINAALALYQQLLEENPEETDLYYNVAYCLKKEGNHLAAIEFYKKVLETQPTSSRTLLGIAQAYMSAGNLPKSFECFARYNDQCRKFEKTLVSPLQIPNKTIFIRAEWEHEDMFQLMRYVNMIHTAGGKTIVQTPSALAPLLRECPYITKIITDHDQVIPPFDFQIPLTNLPHLFKTTLNTIPQEVPYLTIDTKRNSSWKRKLQLDCNYKVGFFLNNNETFDNNAENKNIPLTLLNQFAQLHSLSLYALQPIGAKDSALLDPMIIINQCGSGFAKHEDVTLLELTALINNLHLIITRDAPLAHLAGALGLPVWLLLPYNADYRWMKEGTTCPWYPTMRIFRQATPGDWQTVFKQVATQLAIEVENTFL